MAESEKMTIDDTARKEYVQLTQVRVPLHDAAEAFAQRDASGRLPIVIIPERLSRLSNQFVVTGLLAILAGVVAAILLDDAIYIPLALPIGIALVILGLYRSFMVRIPEGVNALLIRGGRYDKTIGSGMNLVPPWILVSHLVTQREIPFDVPVLEAPTRDNVRANVDTLITFTISDPYKFVYSIAADDFDQIFQAACQDGLRQMVRHITSDQVIDLIQHDVIDLRETLSAQVEAYGVTVAKVVITYAQPPAEFMHSLEARQLAAVQQAEQAERQALAQRRQADAEVLLRQEVIARVEREREQLQLRIQQAEARQRVVELEAKTEAYRLAQLEERLRSYPLAAQYEWESAQLSVARALAGNTRAVVQLGDAGEIARAFALSDLMRFAPLRQPTPDPTDPDNSDDGAPMRVEGPQDEESEPSGA
jgi:regulator of protease activity HflC (stomatin/prohibitin superfamily)